MVSSLNKGVNVESNVTFCMCSRIQTVNSKEGLRKIAIEILTTGEKEEMVGGPDKIGKIGKIGQIDKIDKIEMIGIAGTIGTAIGIGKGIAIVTGPEIEIGTAILMTDDQEKTAIDNSETAVTQGIILELTDNHVMKRSGQNGLTQVLLEHRNRLHPTGNE